MHRGEMAAKIRFLMSPASKEGVEDGVMSVFLLLLGVVTTAVGLALVASGTTTDTDIITPGTIAAVGGLLLVGIGLVVRELQRIEQALRPAQPGEAPAVAAAEPPARIPFPPKPKANSQPEPLVADTTPPSPAAQPVPAVPPSPPAPSPAATPAPAAAEDGAFERLRAKFPTLARLENGTVADRPDVPMVTQPLAAAEGNVGEVKKAAAVAGGRTNGAAPARAAPRPDMKTRPAALDRAKTSVFNAFWPAAPRRDAPMAPTHVAAPAPPPASEPAAVRGTAHDSSPAAGDAAAPVSALKSGVVEGMAYTLYSDGSIEAQLPQGKLRFGSITALRNHIERGV
ncbi:MAG: hypothetical protein WAK63_03435 [Xanthobacteraceae bacterium]